MTEAVRAVVSWLRSAAADQLANQTLQPNELPNIGVGTLRGRVAPCVVPNVGVATMRRADAEGCTKTCG